MRDEQRFERLRSLAPVEAVQAWLEGDFGFEDEPALIEAIRKDPRVRLSDDEIIETVMDAMDGQTDAATVLERLTGSR